MKFEKPKNENYAAVVFEIKSIIFLENCDNVVATTIFGNNIIVSKDTMIGDIGIYFPAESRLSDVYLAENNLYRDKELNKDKTKAGYFEKNGRIRAMRFRGHQSCGLFMPLSSLDFVLKDAKNHLSVGDQFDEINSVEICRKYEIVKKNQQSSCNASKKKKAESKIIDNQFRFHESTNHFAKNMHLFEPGDFISITKKLHGTSVVISNVLCKKKLTLFEKFLKFVGVNIVDKEYSNVYSSRTVVKNPDVNDTGFYKCDIWKVANDRIKHLLPAGMTVYAEIVGYLENGGYIQKGYDYGCQHGSCEVYVYRITYTNFDGNVFEFSAKQVQNWCRMNGVKAVPELYYGRVNEFLFFKNLSDRDNFEKWFLERMKSCYLENDCDMCQNNVPDEGVVIRKDANDLQAFKLKSFRFIERETKMLDAGEVSVEDCEVESSEEEAA